MNSKTLSNINRSKSISIVIAAFAFSVFFIYTSSKIIFILFPIWVLVSEYLVESFTKSGFIKNPSMATYVSIILVFFPILTLVLIDYLYLFSLIIPNLFFC